MILSVFSVISFTCIARFVFLVLHSSGFGFEISEFSLFTIAFRFLTLALIDSLAHSLAIFLSFFLSVYIYLSLPVSVSVCVCASESYKPPWPSI